MKEREKSKKKKEKRTRKLTVKKKSREREKTGNDQQHLRFAESCVPLHFLKLSCSTALFAVDFSRGGERKDGKWRNKNGIRQEKTGRKLKVQKKKL